ncbi:MAG: CDP-glycerol glycerophosphotransferase family protein, partial [Candidatus Kryptoniota bacterium]
AASHDLTPLLAEIARSDEHWHKTVADRAPELVRALYLGLLGREPKPEALHGYVEKLAASHDLTPLLAEIGASDDLWQKLFRAHAPQLVTEMYRGILEREPDPGGLKAYVKSINEPGGIQKAISAIIQSTEFKRLQQKKLLSKHDASAINFGDGFYALENNQFRWSKKSSSLTLAQPATIYLATNVRPNSVFKVNIQYDDINRIIEIDDTFTAIELSFNITKPTRISFNVIQCDEGLSSDSRELAFQVYCTTPHDRYIKRTKKIIFCYADKKDYDSLKPVYDEYKQKIDSTDVGLLSATDAVDVYERNKVDDFVFIIAYATSYARLHNAGAKGTFVYIEHGIAPLKRYTYGGHYRQYDYVLLPGGLWVDRLLNLYPELEGRCITVGFPKLRKEIVTPEERKEFCDRFRLNPEKPIVLFAPTWSGGKRTAGLFNIFYFSEEFNLVAIPHDGDVRFVEEIKKEAGQRVIHVLSPGETISDYYSFADILVSDISSTAIEFMALGKPAICIKTRVTSDFDQQFQSADGEITIPYTHYKWDFCPMVEPAQLNDKLREIITRDCMEVSVPELVTKMCDCYGEEAAKRVVTALELIVKKTNTPAPIKSDEIPWEVMS